MESTELAPGEIWVKGFQCRCGHVWVNRDPRNPTRPRVCPRCKSPYWDSPRVRKSKAERGQEGD